MSEAVEEIDVPDAPVITAAVETMIHNAGMEVRQFPVGPNEEITLLRFHTPAMVYTVRLDQDGVDVLVSALSKGRATDILIARPGDIPGLR